MNRYWNKNLCNCANKFWTIVSVEAVENILTVNYYSLSLLILHNLYSMTQTCN